MASLKPPSTSIKSAVFHRNLSASLPAVVNAQGLRLFLEDGSAILDASCGAAVSCLGHGDERIIEAAAQQMRQVAYCSTLSYATPTLEKLCEMLVEPTGGGRMSRVCIVSGGSEAMEASIKLARQYFLEKVPPEPQRTRFIARHQSYHGTTIGTLAVGGHEYRRAKFQPLLGEQSSCVSPCRPYRNQLAGETDAEYVRRLANELDAEFERVGLDTVCAFVAEPVVGAALGCVPAVPGYLEAIRRVCDKHGALLLDEVMCGMGRTGTLHAWEQEGVVPDIQAIGKSLGAGFIPIAGVLVHRRVADALARGSGAFVHGHTFQGHPAACAAALRVQEVIQADNLLQNVRAMGELLRRSLEDNLNSHPNVGDIRGRGLFWGIELVRDKTSKQPFPLSAGVAAGISAMGLDSEFGVTVYPAGGTADGEGRDSVILAPPFNVTADEILAIAQAVTRLVTRYFERR